MILTMIKTFDQLLSKSWPSNAWLKVHGISVYARHSKHSINGEVMDLLDIANVSVPEPGTGKLGAVLDEAEQAAKRAGIRGVYVENVLNERLWAWLERRGYELVSTGIIPSYWRAVNE